MSSNPSAQLSPREEQQRPSLCSYTTSFLDTGFFHRPCMLFRARVWVSSPLATISFKWLSSALMTSSAVFPWNGASHGPPICLQVIVFTYHLLLVLSPPFGRAGHGHA